MFRNQEKDKLFELELKINTIARNLDHLVDELAKIKNEIEQVREKALD